MKFRLRLLTTCFAIGLVSACATPSASAPEQAMAEEPTEQSAMTETEAMTDTHAVSDTMAMTGTHAVSETMAMTDTHAVSETMAAEPAMTDKSDAMMKDLPTWQTMALTNARSGETFTLADFAGKTVFVEAMATWCPNCRQQLANVKSAFERANADQVVFVAISVETDLAPTDLAKYADDNGFNWIFAVATPEMVQALAATFGQTIATPPSTPHFLILPDSTHGELVTGFESGDQILTNLAQ